ALADCHGNAGCLVCNCYPAQGGAMGLDGRNDGVRGREAGVGGGGEEPRLLDRVRGRLRVKHYSLRTEQAYVAWIRRFILANGKRHPRELGGAEVEAFLTGLATQGRVAAGTQHQAAAAGVVPYRGVVRVALPANEGAEVEAFLTGLATQGRVAAGTQNQALAALLFLYREVLRVDLPWMESVVRAKRPRRLPVVLSQVEVRRLLAAIDERSWPMAALLYGTGIRLMECLRLRVQDVDFARNQITVRGGKGGKDRHVPLPESLREALLATIER